jgi:hypothetical protein
MKNLSFAVFAAALLPWAMTSATVHGADGETPTSAPTSGPTSAPTSAPAGVLVVWDGETKSNAQCWAGGAIKVQGKEVHAGKQALAWTAKGARAHNGWNWFGWHPADAGTDISDYTNFVFWIKGAGAKKPPDIWVDLVSNNKNSATQQIGIGKYCPNAFDGEWHEVVIPLKALYGDKKDFGPKKTWELDISAPWNDSVFDFVAYIDDIGFTK